MPSQVAEALILKSSKHQCQYMQKVEVKDVKREWHTTKDNQSI